MPEINGIALPFVPAGGIKELQQENVRSNRIDSRISFKELFDEELSKVKFSAHAKTRMDSRNISISPEEVSRLEDAFSKAKEKGANESLILINEKAFIVSVKNKTVITVVDKMNLSNTVFTNIDSAVIA